VDGLHLKGDFHIILYHLCTNRTVTFTSHFIVGKNNLLSICCIAFILGAGGGDILIVYLVP